jgi:hypothetical protein
LLTNITRCSSFYFFKNAKVGMKIKYIIFHANRCSLAYLKTWTSSETYLNIGWCLTLGMFKQTSLKSHRIF